MTDIEAIQKEIRSLKRRRGVLWREQEERQVEVKAINEKIEANERAVFEARRDAGVFDLDVLTRETFAELNRFAQDAGMDVYRWVDKHLDKFHKRISRSGMYNDRTKQEIFDLSLSRNQKIGRKLVSAVKRVTELAPEKARPVTWKLFDRRLSRDGIHEMEVWPDDWTARISITTYGRATPQEKGSLEDVLAEAARHHWYSDPKASDDDDDDY